jgi:non-ribosomal peptide synthetase component F
VVTGIQVLTRDDESFKHLVGWLINTVFFRQRIDDGLTFRQLVCRTDGDLDEAFAHKVYPMEKLLAELDVSLDALGGVNLNYLSFDTDGAAPGDFSHGHQPGNYFPYFDLDCYFFHYANGIGLQCIYKTDLFAPETIELFCDRYLALLEQVAGHPEEKLKAVLAEPTVAQTA